MKTAAKELVHEQIGRITAELSPIVDMSQLRGVLRQHESMKRHVSWRAGGTAAYFYQPADIEDLAVFLRLWPQDRPIVMLGLGSNLLVRDGGFSGAIVALHARLSELQLVERNATSGLVYAGAGVTCAKLAKFAVTHNLSGAEFLAGIPGTVGGALAMNAGCFGTETWERAEQVHTVDRLGVLRERTPQAYQIGYRQVTLIDPEAINAAENWFIGGWFRLQTGKQMASREVVRSLLTKRNQSQPLGLPSAGSVFRNPSGDYAARLIEQCGLKGLRVGDAMVAMQHANFILNLDQASATDIEAVIRTVQHRVLEKTGICLETEVRIIGQEATHEDA